MRKRESKTSELKRAEPELKLINMETVEVERIEWLMYPFIPFGKVTIIQGDPGEGKTTMVLQIIAKLTRGEPILLDDKFEKELQNDKKESLTLQVLSKNASIEPVNVIYQTAEDGLGDTIKPRLLAAGADCSRVLVIDDREQPLTMLDLEERKAELLEENSAFEAINGALCNQLVQVNEELDSSEEELLQSRREADKAKKQADKYQKRINELAPMVKNMERLAAKFSANPEELLPEAVIVETGKAYREKKAKPLVEKIVKVLRSVYSAFLDLSNRFERLQESYSRERSRNEHLKGRLQEMIDENRELRETAEDMECVKAVFGSQKVDEAISQAKRQEKIERERKQTMKKKHDREAI